MVIESVNRLEYLQYQKLIQEYRELHGNRKLVIWGRGICGLQLGWVCEQAEIDFVYTDRNEEYWNTSIILDEKIAGKEYLTICPDEVLINRKAYYVIVAMERGQDVVKRLESCGGVLSRDFIAISSATENEVIWQYGQEDEKKNELVLGDCSLVGISCQESDKRSLKDMLEEAYGQICVVAMANVYMRAYYNLYRLMQAKHPVKRLVIFLDVSIFAPKYNELAKVQHVEMWKKLTGGMYGDRELDDFLAVMCERAQNSLMDFSVPDRGKAEDEEKVKKNKYTHMRLNYLFRIKEDENIVYIRKLIDECMENGTSLAVVLLPVNYREGMELADSLFSERYEQIRERLFDEIRHRGKAGCSVCDLSYLLPKEDFISVRSINEGYRYSGRVKIMQKIDEELYKRKGRID